MQITITARHGSVSDSLRRATETRLLRLERFEHHPTHAEVFLDAQRGRKQVEMRLTVTGRGQFVARGTASTYRAALDLTSARLCRQVQRKRERQHDHQAPRLAARVTAGAARPSTGR
jgi:ribosomal subunit interface protein